MANNKKKYTFNSKINSFYKLSQKERRSKLLHALEKANENFQQAFEKKIGKREGYQHYYKEQANMVNQALVSGFMSARFRGKLGAEYKIIKMAEKGATAQQILGYVQKRLGMKTVRSSIDNKSKMLELASYGIIYTQSTSKSINGVRVLYFKDLTQAGKVIVIPDSQFQRMSVDDILIEFGRFSGKRSIETEEEIPIIYSSQKRW